MAEPARLDDAHPGSGAGLYRPHLPRPGFEAELEKRSLTHLYNARPAWLANAQRALDTAVAAEVLPRLLGR